MLRSLLTSRARHVASLRLPCVPSWRTATTSTRLVTASSTAAARRRLLARPLAPERSRLSYFSTATADLDEDSALTTPSTSLWRRQKVRNVAVIAHGKFLLPRQDRRMRAGVVALSPLLGLFSATRSSQFILLLLLVYILPCSLQFPTTNPAFLATHSRSRQDDHGRRTLKGGRPESPWRKQQPRPDAQPTHGFGGIGN
jgi:hypothetical protein